MITSAFTCTGPYAILIMLGIKRVENRSQMPVPSTGRCAVSCSKSFNAAEFGNFMQWVSRALPLDEFARLPSWADVMDWPGKVVGVCDYSCMHLLDGRLGSEPEPWNEGCDYWWQLSNVVCFDQPIPCRGNVGMWQMPSALAAQVTAADSLARCVGEKIATVADAERLFRLAMPIVGKVEGLFVLPLDDECRAISEPILVSLGDPTTAVVDPGEVFSAALKLDARAVILAHNHPSGNPTPSKCDIEMTRALVSVGKLMNIPILDHLIIGDLSHDHLRVVSIVAS